MQMLDSRGTGGGASGGDFSQSQSYSSSGASSQAAPRNAPTAMSEPAGGFDAFDDDIPF